MLGRRRRADEEVQVRDALGREVGLDLDRANVLRPRNSLAAQRFFGAPEYQRKYYGIKRQIRFQRQFPLSQYSYYPLRRGGEQSLDLFGPSFRTATPEQRENRRANLMSGRGRYMKGKGLYRGRGGFFGNLLGGKLGSDIGDAMWNIGKRFVPAPYRAAADAVFDVTDKMAGSGRYMRGKGRYMKGRGAYAVNNLVTDGGATASSIVPAFNPSDVHEVVYSNREYVRDIFAPAAGTVFAIQTWPLNPGLPDSFPWLSQMAINFEEYEIMQLCYTYKSTVADFASASGQVGQIVMATQYNPNSDTFADKEEMMLYEGGMSCKTTESLIHGIECDPSKNSGTAGKYVRAGHLPPAEDLKNYDLGKTSLAVLNAPSTYAGQQLGELWVSYTVRLRKPKFAAGNAYNVRRDFFQIPEIDTNVNGNFLNSVTSISGARNSLGTTLQLTSANSAQTQTTVGGADLLLCRTPTTPSAAFALAFTLIIPPSYAGVLRIRVMGLNKNTSPSGFSLIPVSLSPQTIFRFKDIPQPFLAEYTSNGSVTMSQALNWTHLVNTNQDRPYASSSQRQCDCELHIRVQPALAGTANAIQFGLADVANQVLFIPYIEITQMNTFLNVQDNGSNDRLDLLTQSSAPFTYA
jgi:hypothetical protein